MTAEEVLRRAARRLENTGWIKGCAGDRCGPNCLAGAIIHEAQFDADIAVLYSPLYQSASGILLSVLKEVYGDMHDLRYVEFFNDSLVRSQAEAVQFLEKAAARAAELGL